MSDMSCTIQRRLIVPGRWLFGERNEKETKIHAVQHLAAIVESSDDAIISKDLDGTITSWNPAAERLFGYTAREAIGASSTILIPDDRQGEEQCILAHLRRGERINNYETVRRRKDGTLVDISLTVSPILDSDGVIIGASKIARDISERRRAAEHQNLLLGEMKHRARNLIALIDALARQSRSRNNPTVDKFISSFVGRLRALLSAGELALESPTRNADLKQILETALQPFVVPTGPTRIFVHGPSIKVRERTAGGLALAMHELATNAFKYGALMASRGTVSVRWSIESSDDRQRVRIEWKEFGGEPVNGEPDRTGFGRRVIGCAVAEERDNKTDLLFEPDGVRCVFQFTADTTIA